MSIGDEAILLKKFSLSETSLILHWMTKEHGIIKCVAKGALKPKNKFHQKTELFTQAELLWAPSTRSDLHQQIDIEIKRRRNAISERYKNFLAASYFVELLESSSEFDAPSYESYDLIERGFNFLTEKDITRKAVIHFEKQLAEILGYGSSMEEVNSLKNQNKKVSRLRQKCLEGL